MPALLRLFTAYYFCGVLTDESAWRYSCLFFPEMCPVQTFGPLSNCNYFVLSPFMLLALTRKAQNVSVSACNCSFLQNWLLLYPSGKRCAAVRGEEGL